MLLELSTDNQSLEIKRSCENHNHCISREIFERLPQQRQMPPEIVQEVKEGLKLKANSKLLQRKVESTTGKRVTLKDIANLRQRLKISVTSNDLKEIVEFLKGKPGSTVEVVVDEENNFQSIFYQDTYMKTIYDKYPEIILVDAKYKLLELRFPIYIIMNIDGDGQSEIVALFVLSEETKAAVQKVVEVFKKHNLKWKETTAVMSDKDFNERDAFANSFPHATLLICLYHTFRTFRHEVTCEKMGITSEERLRCLEIIQQIAYSQTQQHYDINTQLLRQTKLQSVIRYYEQNWEPIKHQWVCAFKNEIFNLGETTNNRVESNFNKLKSVCSKHTSFLQFFMEFFSFLGVIRNERNHHHIMAISRKEIIKFEDPDLQLYHDFLTPYAFKKVKATFETIKMVEYDFKQLEDGTFTTNRTCGQHLYLTEATCSCSYMSMLCQHVLKLRSSNSLPLFHSSLINYRWTNALLNNVLEQKAGDIEDLPTESVELVVTQNESKLSIEPTAVLYQAQKYKKLLRTCQLLASIGSEGGMATFGVRSLRAFANYSLKMATWRRCGFV